MITLSKHVTDEMTGRRISLPMIEATIGEPAWTRADPVDASLTRAYREIASFGGRVLRVVYRCIGDDVFVVTAHWDRGAKP